MAIAQIYSFDAYGNALGFDTAEALTEFLYSGEQFDSKIGQQYLRARYYDPATGRFDRLDPFFGNLTDPQSLHKYTYAHNDPVDKYDPSGEFAIFPVLALVITFFLLSSRTVHAPALGDSTSGSISVPRDNMIITPREAYWGWFFGTHNGNQFYPNGSKMSKALSTHSVFERVREDIRNNIDIERDPNLTSWPLLDGVGFDLESSMENENVWGRAGQVYNASYDFLYFLYGRTIFASDADQLKGAIGSFNYTWKVTGIDWTNMTATVKYKVFNRAGLKSFLYGIGKDYWGTPLDQSFEWTETISVDDSNNYPTYDYNSDYYYYYDFDML
jgi:RHS repeat-associated protein